MMLSKDLGNLLKHSMYSGLSCSIASSFLIKNGTTLFLLRRILDWHKRNLRKSYKSMNQIPFSNTIWLRYESPRGMCFQLMSEITRVKFGIYEWRLMVKEVQSGDWLTWTGDPRLLL